MAKYSQAYCSIRLTSMAASFGVSPQFLDRCVEWRAASSFADSLCRDLSDLIYCGRLPCKIDAVKGIIESVRMDSHNSLCAAHPFLPLLMLRCASFHSITLSFNANLSVAALC
jgi:hypothetical protein